MADDDHQAADPADENDYVPLSPPELARKNARYDTGGFAGLGAVFGGLGCISDGPMSVAIGAVLGGTLGCGASLAYIWVRARWASRRYRKAS